jgi:hypothetical protein
LTRYDERVRRLSLLLSTTAAAGLGLALMPGCRDATQVTVEISLAKRASCTETNGTAITVGTDPAGTQKRVEDQFVTATTTSCTEADHQIGTLVVTPSSSGGGGRASIIVVVAYDKTIVPSACKPPLFKGCVVARRQFTFTEYQQLHLPITIDPDCKDVPCDAFSTCRTGKCFSSDVSCDGDGCLEPGDPGDGGTSVDGQVDTGTDSPTVLVDGGGTDASDADSDADASDGSTSAEAGAPGAYCDVDGNLICPEPTLCNAGNACCGPGAGVAVTKCNVGTASCTPSVTQYCCTKAPCPNLKPCSAAVVLFPSPAWPGANANGALPGGATAAGTCAP